MLINEADFEECFAQQKMHSSNATCRVLQICALLLQSLSQLEKLGIASPGNIAVCIEGGDGKGLRMHAPSKPARLNISLIPASDDCSPST